MLCYSAKKALTPKEKIENWFSIKVNSKETKEKRFK